MELFQQAKELRKEIPDDKKATQKKVAGKIVIRPTSGSIENIEAVLNNVLSNA